MTFSQNKPVIEGIHYPLNFLFIPRAEIRRPTFNLLNLVSGGLKKLRVKAFILVGEMNKTFINNRNKYSHEPTKKRESVCKVSVKYVMKPRRRLDHDIARLRVLHHWEGGNKHAEVLNVAS